ncbi:MAG: hypothetical protein R2843_03980 [Thermomicrobiales bacterium]
MPTKLPVMFFYFRVRSFPEYGKLSHRNLDDLLKPVPGIDVDERKDDPLDFALWKAAKPGEPWWRARGVVVAQGGTSSALRCARII